MNKWTEILIVTLVLIIIGLGIWMTLNLIKSDVPEPSPAVLYKRDTVTVVEYKDVIKYRDKFIYKTIYTNVTPLVPSAEVVHDTTFINSVKYRDMILSLEKQRKKIIVFGWNENDSLLKKYEFENVGNEFVAYADSGAVRIDKKRVEWTGLDLFVRSEFTVSKTFLRDATGQFIEDRNHSIGLKTGIQMGKIGIDGSMHYNLFNRDWILEGQLNLKLY